MYGESHIMAPFVREVSVAFKKAGRAFTSVWWTRIEMVYLESHKRLPGSTRTCRLRKKRKTKLSEWWDKNT